LRSQFEVKDPKDDFLIAIVEHGAANALVSDNIGVLELEQIGGKLVLTPAEFLECVNMNGSGRVLMLEPGFSHVLKPLERTQ
jgi:predicted nucleic acid-binding protein